MTTNEPQTLQGDLHNLPSALDPLKALKNWVCWKWEWRVDKNGGGKWTKPPFQPKNGRYANNTDPATWDSYEAALTAFAKGCYAGIGINLLDTSVGAFDLDKCRDPQSGDIHPKAMAIVSQAASYTEMTPSGTGLRVIGTSSGLSRLQRKQKIKGSTVEVESYRGCARYITITGLPLPNTAPAMADIGGVIDAVVAELDGAAARAGQHFEAEWRKPFDEWRKANPGQHRGELDIWIELYGKRNAGPDDFNTDDSKLPARLMKVLKNEPPAKDLSAAFHGAVNSLFELGWSARRIDNYIESAPVVPQRYIDDGRLLQEIYRCLFNADRERARKDAKEEQAAAPARKLLQPSGEFVANFVPPDYLIDGLLQRRYVYSFTSPTGGGKTSIALLIAMHVAYGTPLADREVEKGRVLFFAGENPDDVRTRWIKLTEVLGKDPDAVDVVFMPITLDLTEQKTREKIDEEAATHGPFSLLIVDTSAAYYSGDDENDNVKLGAHARMLRSFVDLPGGPTVLVTCHPVKNPDMNNLLPRGGGAFLAEVDGNLVCIKDTSTMVVEVTTHGKFRGPDFAPFAFKLVAGQSPTLTDSKGRLIWTIFAQSISNEEQTQIEKAGHSEQDKVLRAMLEQPGRSLSDLAAQLGWTTTDGQPNKNKVHRTMKDLQKAKLVERQRGGHYVLTPKGQKEAAKTPASLATILKKSQPEADA